MDDFRLYREAVTTAADQGDLLMVSDKVNTATS